VQQADIPQLPNNAVQIRVFYHGLEYKVIIDYIDKPETIFDDYLKDCLVYFKMQFSNGGYDDRRIVPGLYVPTSGMDMYHYLPRLRRIRDDFARTEFDVYGRFGLYRSDPINTSWHDVEMTGRDIRNRALRILETQEKFRYQGGGNLLAITRSLCEVARSNICIDLPGRGPFCHRLVDYLSIGSCIISYPHEATFHLPLTPGKHIVYCRTDFSDLVELCQYYLGHEQERRAMVQASREYFDTYLHKDCIAAYYLECISSRLGLSLEQLSPTHTKDVDGLHK
jgi:hypothetical protein